MSTREEYMLQTFMRFILSKMDNVHTPQETRMLLETYEALHELMIGEYQHD